MRLEDVDLTNPDHFVPGVPYPMFDVLRNEAPVYWHPEQYGPGFWAVTGYADVVRSTRTTSAA